MERNQSNTNWRVQERYKFSDRGDGGREKGKEANFKEKVESEKVARFLEVGLCRK